MPLVFPDQPASKAAAQTASDAAQVAAQGVMPQKTQQPTGRLVFPQERERTWGQAAADTGVQLAEGVNTILGAIPSLVAPDSSAAGFFRDNAEFWRKKQSAPLQVRSDLANVAIDKAGEDGVIAQVLEAASQYSDDPGLAARFVVTNLPSMIPSIGAAKLAQVATAARTAAAVKAGTMSQAAATAAGAAAATTAGGVTNAALNAGGARGESFEDIKRTLLQRGYSEEEATQRALDDSRLPAAVGGVTGFISGRTGLESALFGVGGTGNVVRRGVGKTLAELGGEQLEEVAPKVATNLQAGQYDNRPLTQDVGRTIVETAIGSGPQSVVAGVSEALRGDPAAPTGTPALAGQPPAPAPAPVQAPPAPPVAPAGTIVPPAGGPGAPGAAVPPLVDPANIPPELDAQNRDRTRPASVLQMQSIAQSPDYLRLGPSRSPDTGAPMVFAQGDDTSVIPDVARGRQDIAVMSDGQRVPFTYAVVDASLLQPSNFADGTPNPLFGDETPGLIKALNNGRSAGLRAAWAQGTASGYGTDLEADADQHGVSPEAIRSTRNPVLVRLYSQADNKPNMAARSQGQGLGMSPGELARQDAPLIDGGLLAVWQGGDVADTRNLDFVRGFVGRLQGTGQDLAGMMTQAGTLSPDGRKRIQAALAQAAYGDADLIGEMFDSTDTDIKAIGEALKLAAPEWADMRDSARSGAIDSAADITPALLDAVAMVRRARQQRQSLSDLARQTDITTGQAPDPMVLGALRLLYGGEYLTRPMGRDRMADLLREYTRMAKGITADAGLFGDAPTPSDVLTALTKEDTDGQQQQPGAGQPAQQPSASSQQPTGSGDPRGDAGAGGSTAVRPGDSQSGAQPAAGGAGPLANDNPAGQAPAPGVAPAAPAPGTRSNVAAPKPAPAPAPAPASPPPPAQPEVNAAPAAPARGGDPAVSPNTVFTEDAAAAARARLKAKLGRLNAGIDPETMLDGITLAGYHIERGARTFAAYARAMVDDLGDAVKPYLVSWYLAVRNDPRAADFKADMDKAGAVEDADLDALLADKGKAEAPGSLPAGWTEARPGGMATNPDPKKGGIVDVAPATGGWFAIPNDRALTKTKLEGFKSRADAFSALERAVAQASSQQDAPSLNTPSGRAVLAQTIADRFIGGDGFKTIIEARKFIADATGEKIEAGTQAAKLADEAIEMAVVLAGREIVQAARAQGRDDGVIYDRLVNLYGLQPTLGVRTSTSVREQAYSTPVPLAFLASRLARVAPDSTVGEPTAGNTMLLIEVDPDRATVNELNADRAANARALGFTVTTHDAARHQLAPEKSLDRVIANPPFGAVKDDNRETVVFPVAANYGTREIDHAIAFKALDAMKDDGSAVLILGGVDASNDEAIREGYRGKSKREFYFRLYGLYNVVDHFTVDGGLYSKQGAGYPVDVVVIRGRGKAARAMPAAELPKRYDTWEALKKEKLDGSTEAGADGMVPTGGSTGTGRGDGAQGQQPGTGGLVDGPGGQGAGDGRRGAGPGRGGNVGGEGAGPPGAAGQSGRRGGTGTAQPGASQRPDAGRDGAAQAPVPGQSNRRGGGNAQGDGGNRPGDVGGTGGGQDQRVGSGLSDRRGQEQETETQVAYAPQSGAASVGTLVPRAMRDSIAASLKRVADSVGNIDEFVAQKLGFDPETLRANFSAEQVDALALAIVSAEAGKGFIIGDQTGIGKGRVVAAMLRYAMRNDKVPVFVTEKPNLYADMIRDLDDIGMGDELRLQSSKPLILVTNSSEPIPYVLQRKIGEDVVETEHSLRAPGAGADLEKFFDKIAGDGDIGPYKVVFTTYSQLQTVKGKMTARMRMVQSLADGGYMVFDESHNAGGTQITQPRTKTDRDAAKAGETTTGRSGFVRQLVRASSGSFFSSATYAKRPDVMDLYSSTNMMLAVDKPADLAPAIILGGVPMQQIVATMLAEDGQYIRRERTFAGVTYETRPMTVDRRTAENMAQSMRMILAFSRAKDAAVKSMKREFDREGAVLGVMGGEKTSVQGANFGAIMHNLIDQMLLSLKAQQSVDFAIERLKAGEKVVLTVANTMGSFLSDYAEDFGIRPGEPVTLSFADLYQRYLEKQRMVRIKRPGGPKEGTPYRLTDKDLGPGLVAQFNAVGEFIRGAGFGAAPISPIDYMHQRLRDAGYKTDEITGRTMTVSYGSKVPTLASRRANIKQRLAAIRGFNGGTVDAIILNQSGATGLSLHASAKVKDQRKRRMIIVQAEKNIDTHMQMLGRVHRTGQVITPDYTQAMADIPAEARPASVLLKKMASLNANTTASRKSAVTAEGVVDFMNDYGGQVAAEFLLENPEVHMDLGGNKVIEIPDDATQADEDLIRKLTGYIPILPIDQQEAVYRDLVDRYNELLARENAMGSNKLEAAALDLGAKTEKREQVTAKRESPVPSRFAEPAFMEQVDVARTVKPLTRAEVDEAVAQALAGKTPDAVAEAMVQTIQQQARDYADRVQALRVKQGADTDADERDRMLSEIQTIQAQKDILLDHIRGLQIGQAVTVLDQNQAATYGVITSVVGTGKTKNPVAGSGWRFKIALANGEARSITLSASQINKQFTIRPERGQVLTLDPRTNDVASMSISDLFDAYGTGNIRREKRWMVTGNLLAGFASFSGQIITYTKDDGSTAQGVLMRRGFDYEERKGDAKATLQSADMIRRFFTEAGRNAMIGTPDGVLRVKWMGGSYPAEFEVSSSKRAGGTFFLDRGLTDALGRDFTKSGQVMRVAVTEDDMMSALVYLMTERDDVSLEAKTNKDIARRLLGLPDTTDAQQNRVAREEGAVYRVREQGDEARDIPADLFPDTLESLEPTAADPRVHRKRRSPGGVPVAAADEKPTAVLAVREDPAMPGVYHHSSQLVQVGIRDLPVSKVTNWMEASSALASLGKFAVEHFDALVTDASGRPLAVIGAFKGAEAQASVYPGVVLAEALRIEGAARVWGVHNHPSGNQELSVADRRLSESMRITFEPSSVQWMGIAAIGEGRFQAYDGKAVTEGVLVEGKTVARVPIVERTIQRMNVGMPILSSTAEAKRVMGAWSNNKPGLLFVSNSNQVTAWVPVKPDDMKVLRKDGRFERLMNSATQAGARGVLISNPNGVMNLATLDNIASALRMADVRVLDVIDPSQPRTLSEQGLGARNDRPVFSRTDMPAKGMTRDNAQRIASGAVSAWKNKPRLVVARNIQDPAVPQALRDEDKRQRAGGATGEVRGTFYQGAMYLFSDHLGSDLDVIETVFHEGLGHYGLRGLFGNALDAVLDMINLARPDLMRPKAAEYGADLRNSAHRRYIAEEVLAGMAQSEPTLGFVRRAIAAVRTWLRTNVPGLEKLRLTDAEIIRNFILPARQFVMRGQAQAGAGRDMAAAFQRAQATDSQAFKRWFGASKVVDDQGRPMVMYHGTSRPGFTVFDRLKTLEWRSPSMDTVGSWFSNNPADADGAGLYAAGGNSALYPVYLSIQNPKVYRTFNDFLRHMHKAAGRPMPENAPGRGSTEELRAELKAEGYDGIQFWQTANESLMEDIREMQDAVKRAKDEEFSVPRAQRQPYTQKRERLEQTLKSMRKELDEFGSSTEFDGQRVFVAFEPTQIKSAIGNSGAFDPANADIRFSRVSTPARSPLGFFSALARSLGDISMGAAPTQGWKEAIKGLVNKGAVKADEVEWSGVNDWLDLQQGKVMKADVLAYLNANGVQVAETVLGGSLDDALRAMRQERDDIEARLNALGFEMRDEYGEAVLHKRVNGMDFVWEDGQFVDEDGEPLADTDAEARDLAIQYGMRTDELERARENPDGEGRTKYGQYTLPGGTNYREVLLTLPPSSKLTPMNRWVVVDERGNVAASFNNRQSAEDAREIAAPGYRVEEVFDKQDVSYRSNHWDQPNVIAHVRMNDRTDADGKRVLFVEELQSDWGQEGKKKGGFQPTPARRAEIDAIMAEVDAAGGIHKIDPNGELMKRARQAGDDLVRSNVPAAPFVTKTEGWLNLALKRIMVMAAEGGYDKVAFVNGEQSADRYDLSKQVSTLLHRKNNDGTYYVVAETAGGTIEKPSLTQQSLEDTVGKEVAKKIVAGEGPDNGGGFHALQGLDLKVGGEGMKAFYDQIVPAALKKLLPKVGGGQMGVVKVDGIVRASTGNMEAGDFYDRQENPDFRMLAQPGFDVTPAMREKASTGLPMFSRTLPASGARQTPAQRAEAILATPVTKARPLDRVFRAASRATGLEFVARQAYDRAGHLLDRLTPETVKAGIVSDYGVPEAVIDMRVMLQGRQRQQLRRAGELVDKLSNLTRAESRIAYEWMNMDGSDPRAYLSMMQGLPEESVKVLQEVQRMIDDLSKEAVRLGQLDPRSYERNKFAYLRRTYDRYLEELTPQQQRAHQKATRILGDQYRRRGLTEPVDMAKLKSGDPEWWGRKEREGKGDAGLVNQEFIKLERLKPTGAGTIPLPGMTGKADGKVLEVVYWPAERAVPAKYSEWRRNEVFKVDDVKGGKVVLWRDFTKDEREAMGEVDEARFAIARTLQRMVHDVEVGRYLENLSQKFAKADGDEIDGVLVEASESWHRAFKPSEWVKVPDSKITGTSVHRYGKLAGKYLPGPIWNDVRFAVNGPTRPLGEVYSKILAAWKVSKTALTPAVHMNNVMANLVMADWHDVGAAHVAKALRLILAAHQRDGKGALGRVGNVAAGAGIADREAALAIMNRYRDAGGDIGSWATQEIAREQMAPLLDAVLEELGRDGDASVQGQIGVMAALQNLLHLKLPEAWTAFKASKPATVVGREAQSMIDLYQAEDDVFRLAAWLAAKEQGMDDLRAGREARRSFLDYDINAPWVDAMRRSAWPFIAFTYRAVPMLFEISGKRPHKILKLATLLGALNMLGVAMSGDDEDDEERRRRMLPEEKAGRVWGVVPKLIRMPWNDANGSPVYLDIRRFIPVGDVVDTGATQAALPVPPGLMPGGPLVILGEVLMNKSAFTGKPITLGTDTPAESSAKVFEHLYKGFAPNLPGLPGTYATDALVNAGTGKTDAFGRQQSMAQAMASSVGVKLGSYPEDVLRRNTLGRAGSQRKEIETVMNGLQRQRNMNGISEAEYERKMEVQREKLRKLNQETREKVAQ